MGPVRMRLEQRTGDPQLRGGERTEPGSARGRVRHRAGRAHGKSCTDTWKHVDLGVRTEYWDRGLERCRKFMAIPAVDRQGHEQPCLDADAQSRRLDLRPPEVPSRHISWTIL